MTLGLTGASGGLLTAGLAWAVGEGLQGSHLNPICVPFIDLTEGKHFPDTPAKPGHILQCRGLSSPSTGAPEPPATHRPCSPRSCRCRARPRDTDGARAVPGLMSDPTIHPLLLWHRPVRPPGADPGHQPGVSQPVPSGRGHTGRAFLAREGGMPRRAPPWQGAPRGGGTGAERTRHTTHDTRLPPPLPAPLT